MMRWLICMAASLSPLSAMAMSGSDLGNLCSKGDVASKAACVAYIQGAADGEYNTIEAIGGTTGPRVGQYFCLPGDTTPAQLVSAVREFMMAAPDMRDYNASTVVALGLGKAFPCPGAR
jgi:hypothetical protein